MTDPEALLKQLRREREQLRREKEQQRREKGQLRREKEQPRREKEQLRREKEQLCREKEQLRANNAPAGTEASHLCEDPYSSLQRRKAARNKSRPFETIQE